MDTQCMIGSRCCGGELELLFCPKKDLLTQRIGILEARCCLCDEASETCASLIFLIALWQGLLVLAIVGVSNHTGWGSSVIKTF